MSRQDGSNWYVYCENNPLKYVDPNGLETHIFSSPIGNKHKHLFIAVRNENGEVTTKGLYPKNIKRKLKALVLPGSETPVVFTDRDSFMAKEKSNAEKFFNGEDMDEGYMHEARIEVPNFMTEKEFDRKVLQESNNYPVEQRPYNALDGPNSNTFVDDVIEASGAIMPDIDKATQQNYGEGRGRAGNPNSPTSGSSGNPQPHPFSIGSKYT